MPMVLQVDRASGLFLTSPSVAGIGNLNIIMYFDAVLIYGYAWILFNAAVGI